MMDRVIFQAQIEKLEPMMDWIRAHIDMVGFSSAESRKIQLAMEEALVNVIHYAYNGESGVVELICNSVPREKITFTIMDKGNSFNPLMKNNRVPLDAPLEERTEGGLGIYFIKEFMDEVHYERQHPYNILTLAKTLS